MMALKFLSEECRSYMSHLRQLHDLIATGQGDSEQADSVRDQMDGPWKHMSFEEHGIVRGLSTDIYDVTEKKTLGYRLPKPDDSSRLKLLDAEFKNQDWRRVLELLRQDPPLAPGQTFFIRARCWLEMRVPENAVIFLREIGRASCRERVSKQV